MHMAGNLYPKSSPFTTHWQPQSEMIVFPSRSKSPKDPQSSLCFSCFSREASRRSLANPSSAHTPDGQLVGSRKHLNTWATTDTCWLLLGTSVGTPPRAQQLICGCFFWGSNFGLIACDWLGLNQPGKESRKPLVLNPAMMQKSIFFTLWPWDLAQKWKKIQVLWLRLKLDPRNRGFWDRKNNQLRSQFWAHLGWRFQPKPEKKIQMFQTTSRFYCIVWPQWFPRILHFLWSNTTVWWFKLTSVWWFKLKIAMSND